jgi:hypothetical protein
VDHVKTFACFLKQMVVPVVTGGRDADLSPVR